MMDVVWWVLVHTGPLGWFVAALTGMAHAVRRSNEGLSRWEGTRPGKGTHVRAEHVAPEYVPPVEGAEERESQEP